jgi:GNAT superfamily N-acetyltransferase
VVDARPAEVGVRPVGAEATRALRLAVLRPGQPPEAALYPGDDDATTRHLGAFADGRLVGIASLYAEARPGGASPGWRLRGMATEPTARRRGVGTALLAACVAHVVDEGGGELWANARLSALDFYLRAGFEVVSDRFEVPGIGPHVVVRRLLADERAR